MELIHATRGLWRALKLVAKTTSESLITVLETAPLDDHTACHVYWTAAL
jgi:hypothetical protein